MEKKLTKAMVLEIIADYFSQVEMEKVMSLETQNVCSPAEIVAFATHEMELLAKKKSKGSKPTAKQLENEGFKSDIVRILTDNDRPMTITEIMAEIGNPILTNQRVSALVTQLKNANLIERIEIKKKAYFSIVD